MNLGIEGKTALIVGASRGVGRAVALGLAAEGCRVIGVARSFKALEAVRLEIQGRFGPNSHTMVPIDLMGDHGPQDLVEILREHLGSPDIIYHCMGGSWGALKAWDMPSEDWMKVWRFNLGVAVDLNRLLVPGMLERGWGRVIMTSTDATKCNSGNAPYTSSKFALEGYVKTVSKIWAPKGVILTAIAPGNVYTPGLWTYEQGPEWTAEYYRHHLAAARWAQPEEIAAAILPLCGAPATFMPGAIVRADGGSR